MKKYLEAKKVLEKNGWVQFDIKDDYFYELYFEPVFDDKLSKEERNKQFYEAQLEALENCKDKHNFEKDYYDALRKKYKWVRKHLPKEFTTISHLTESGIDESCNYVCFALDPIIKVEMENIEFAGFIKHLLFLKLDEKGEYIKYFFLRYVPCMADGEHDKIWNVVCKWCYCDSNHR